MMTQREKNGFSLIEMILYIALLSMILIVLVVLFQEVVYVKGKIYNKIEFVDSGNFALNKVVWYLQNAETVNSPGIGQSADNLNLEMTDSSINPVLFYIKDNALMIKKGTDDEVRLTNTNVQVSQLLFSNNSFSEKEQIVQVNIEIVGHNSFWHNNPFMLQTSVKLGNLGQ